MHGQITFYVTFFIIKSLCSKCLIFKSSSGEYLAVKNIKLPSECWNGKIFRSSVSQLLYCLASHTAKHDSLICVIDDKYMYKNDQNRRFKFNNFQNDSLIIDSKNENPTDAKGDNLRCYTDEDGNYVCDKEHGTSTSPCECGTANPTRINKNRIMYPTGTEADILNLTFTLNN